MPRPSGILENVHAQNVENISSILIVLTRYSNLLILK